MGSATEFDFTVRRRIGFSSYDEQDERRRESLFALGNGTLFVRACPSEAATDANYAGTYRAGCYDRRVIEQDGKRFGHDALVNLPNWAWLSFRPAGEAEWFALPAVTVLEYEHSLDMQAGVACRAARVRDAAGRVTRLREQRLVSMARPPVAAFRTEITAENWEGVVEIRSAIEGGVRNGNTDRGSLPPYRHFDVTRCAAAGADMLLLTVRTRHSGIDIAVAARTRIDAATEREVRQETERIAEHDCCSLARGVTLGIEKVAAIVTGRDPATANAEESACDQAAFAPGFKELHGEHALIWSRLWDRAGIEAEDGELDHALAFHAFQVLQTLSPQGVQVDVGLPSRGWQEAYHGQIFWDEIFVFPFLNYRFPEIARSLLLYRYRRLPAARRAAAAAGYAGAMFPWRSATTGDEETPELQPNPISHHWMPDHTRLQRHIGAAVAHNVWHYVLATRDHSFLSEYGAEMMVEIARFWASVVRHDEAEDRFDICGVIGPDEYHDAYPDACEPGLNNNAYTNVMAAATLLRAVAVLEMLPPARRDELEHALAIGQAELARWRHIACRLRLPFAEDGVLSQFDGYDRLRPPDALPEVARGAARIDWALEAAGDSINAYQVTKQADVLMLLYLLRPGELIGLIRGMGYAFDGDAIARTVEFHLARVSHESSLSRVVCAGALAEIDPKRSWEFFERSLLIDIDASNSRSAEEGLHLGAMAGTLDVLQRHYLGLRIGPEGLRLSPMPPARLGPVRMRLAQDTSLLSLAWDGTRLRFAADASNAAPLRGADPRLALVPGGSVEL